MPAAARTPLHALARASGIAEIHVTRGPRVGFRHRARLAIRGRAASPKIGIFETGSHRVVDIPRCLVHHPVVNEVVGELRRALVLTGTPPYSETAHRGLVRYVQVVVERRTRTAQIVLVSSDESPGSIEPLTAKLAERLGGRLHSLFWNGNPERTNTILGSTWKRLLGPEAVEETLGGAQVFYPPGAFGQSNLDLADSLVDAVHGAVPDGSRVLELYAGTGALGLGLVHRSESVVMNELSVDSIRGLTLGIEALPNEARERAKIVPGLAVEATHEIASADVVIVDPPRKGLEADVREALSAAPPARLVYVACGLHSFLADAEALLGRGRLTLRELRVFDLFPHTEHVELVAVFEGKGRVTRR